jgi:hypothetical protein
MIKARATDCSPPTNERRGRPGVSERRRVAPLLVRVLAHAARVAAAAAVVVMVGIAATATAGVIVVGGSTALTGSTEGCFGGAVVHTVSATQYLFVAANAASSLLWKLDATTNAMIGNVALSLGAGVVGENLLAFLRCFPGLV